MNARSVNVLPIGLPVYLVRRLQDNPLVALVDNEQSARPAALLYWDLNRARAREMIESSEYLRWVHVPWVGVENMLTPRVVSGAVALTNSSGAAGKSAAEYVIGAVIAVSKDFHVHLAGRTGPAKSFETFTMREVSGASLLVVGLGDIGQSVAALACDMGMQVRAVNRTPKSLPSCVHVAGLDGLADEVARADFVVLCLPSTPNTHKLFDSKVLARMRPTAWLINVGRGDVIDTDAMTGALERRSFAGAFLDVTDPEPLPVAHRLRALHNVVITPHTATWTRERFERAFLIFEANIVPFLQGEALTNQVHVASPGPAVRVTTAEQRR